MKEHGRVWRNLQRQTNPNSAQTEGRDGIMNDECRILKWGLSEIAECGFRIAEWSATTMTRPSRIMDHESRITTRAEAASRWAQSVAPNEAKLRQERQARQGPGLMSMVDNGKQCCPRVVARLDVWRPRAYRRSAAVRPGALARESRPGGGRAAPRWSSGAGVVARLSL